MKTTFEKDNLLLKLLRKYKESELKKMKSAEYEVLLEKVREDEEPMIVTVKYDGVFNLLFVNRKNAFLLTESGRKTEDLPSLHEAVEALKDSDFYTFIGFAEEYAVGKYGEKLPLNEVMHLLRKPTAEEEGQIRIAVFDVFSVDGRVVDEPYWKRFLLIRQIFSDKGLVHVVAGKRGKKPVLQDLWEKNVIGKDMEGLVVHLDDVVKIKPVQSYDLVVIGVERSSKHNERMGSLWLAFMDKDDVLRFAGRVGTGFTDQDRLDWVEWAVKHRVSGPYQERLIWVQPVRVVEVIAETVNVRPSEAYYYLSRKYLESEKKPSGVLIKPRYVRDRADKKVNSKDLRLTQIPDFEQRAKMLE